MNESDGSGYFIYHSIGQYPGKAEDSARALSEFAAFWGRCDDRQWQNALPLRGRFIDLWRGLINAPEGTLTTCENVTAGLYALLGALPAEHLQGRRVLVAGDCFPSLHFLLSGLAPRLGFTLDTVPLRPGASWVEDDDVIARWGPDVGLALLTWVSSTSSHRCDLDRLVAHGRLHDSVIGVDITQAAGLLPFDVEQPAIDFTVSTSLKWLCAMPGAGILHVATPLIAECHPEFRGWFSQDNPFSWDLDAFRFAPDIRRFDNGTPAIVSAVGSVPALEWHARQDMTQLRAHNAALSERIIEGVGDVGLTLVSPRAAEARGGSVMIDLGTEAATGEMLAALRERDIHADARGRVLRLSPGTMTSNAGVDRLLETLGDAARPRARAAT